MAQSAESGDACPESARHNGRVTVAADPNSLLPDDLLERIRFRAAQHDRDNTFPHDDLEDLRAAGYLRILVPAELGGSGKTLAEASVLQQRLATAAPATALAVNMHLVWTGVAAVLARWGEHGLQFVLEGAADDQIFAFGISEPGNDQVLLDSKTDAAARADGSYAFTGMKIFTSLSPVWTQLGVHGRDETSPDAPRIVYGFVPRDEVDNGRVLIRDDWDTLGMRGTQSQTTELHGAIVPADRVVRRIEPGQGDEFTLAIFAVFELLLASVYTGIGRRALDIAVAAAAHRSDNPEVRRRIGAIGLDYDAIGPQIQQLCQDVCAHVSHGDRWFSLLSGVKHRAVSTATRIVDQAVTVLGGSAYSSSHELSRLLRDVRAGQFHPTNPDAAHQASATAWLGPPPS